MQILATDAGRVIGRLDLVAAEIDGPAGPVPCFFGSALEVSNAARGRGVGTALLHEQESLRPASAACGPSRLSFPLYSKLGYTAIALPRYVLVRRTGPLLERWLGHGIGQRAAAFVADGAVASHQRLLRAARKRAARSLTSEAVDAWPHGLGLGRYDRDAFAFHRSPAWLDWLVRESFLEPGDHRRGLYVVRDAAGTAVAYFLVKSRVYSGVTEWGFDRLDLGSLVDWGGLVPAAVRFDQLALLAIEALSAWDVGAIEVCVPPDVTASRLRRLGLVRVRAQHVMVRDTSGDPRLQGSGDASRWRVRPGEGDYAFS